jgi:hypothetical protein
MTGAPDGRTVEAVARQARDLAEGLFAMVWPRNADEILAGRNFATGALADMLLPHLLASRALAAERITALEREKGERWGAGKGHSRWSQAERLFCVECDPSGRPEGGTR